MPAFDMAGWHLLGAFPDPADDGVGSWLLHHAGEALLLEVPPGVTPAHVRAGLDALGGPALRFVTASHGHWDHLDRAGWAVLRQAFPTAEFVRPSAVQDDWRLDLAGEPVWLVKAPKHSPSDVVTVFRGVAMTGDIELGTLDAVNREVPRAARRASFDRLRGFPVRTGYHIHAVVSAHLNDFRTGVDWPALFTAD